nr:NAD(P)H-dependent oxidoreductase [Halomonas sp. ML-15]
MEGKRAVLLARGGQYAGTPLDSQLPHLKAMLGLIGITEVETIFAEGLSTGQQASAREEAKQAIEGVVKRL